jgi:MYXO-CTERM domain-containing protein
VNDAPVATPQSVTTAEDTAVAITLAGTDVDGDSLSFAVVTQPAHGALTGSGASLTYTPAANYNGADSFTFKANDGALDSAAATVSLTVQAVNDAPVFDAIALQVVPKDSGTHSLPVTGIGPGGGPDEAAQTVTLVATSSAPAVVANPSVTGSGSTRTLSFSPVAGASGTATITVTATDNGGPDTFSREFDIDVTATNHAPVAQAGNASSAGAAIAITLQGSDADGDVLTYTVVTQPSHGALEGAAPSLVYTPEAGFAGIDRFTFTVNDGQADSAPAEFAVTVTAAPKAGGCGCTTTSDFGLAGLLGLLALTRARSAPRRTRPLGGP